MGLVFPTQHGGSGGNFLDLTILIEEMGRVCYISPYFTSVVLGGLTILEMGDVAQKSVYLPRIASGDLIVTSVLTGPMRTADGGFDHTKAKLKDKRYILNGKELFVPDLNLARYVICSAKLDLDNSDNGVGIFLLDCNTPGLSYKSLKTAAEDRQFEVQFTDVAVPKENILYTAQDCQTKLDDLLLMFAVAKCAELIGSAQHVLQMTVDHASQRIQFSRPIGSFQAIQHHCANMAVDIDISKLLTYQAAWKISNNLPYRVEAAMAKAWVSEASRRIFSLAHQVIAGVGFTEDHDLPAHTKRALATQVIYGDADYHREIVADAIGL
jgi:alkylation response protein AidB-like acyl-CoA dehydrogenase